MAKNFPYTYGSMYIPTGTEITVTINSATNYLEIPATWTTGLLSGVDFGSNYLQCRYEGRYLVTYNLSMKCATANQDCYAVIYDDGGRKDNTASRAYLATANQYYNFYGAALSGFLGATKVIKLHVRNASGLNNLIVTNANVLVVRMNPN